MKFLKRVWLLVVKSRQEQVQSGLKWVPYNKGGIFRKWYGNNTYVVNWENDGYEIKENTKLNYPDLGDNLGWKISNEDYYYKKGITWSGVTSGNFSCRYYEEGFIFDSGANGLFAYDEGDRLYLAGLLNSAVGNYILKILNPTINTGSGTLNQVPTIMHSSQKNMISKLVDQSIKLSNLDWNLFEISWDFKKLPLFKYQGNRKLIEDEYNNWSEEIDERFKQLKENEEELNRIFIDIYGLEDELTPEVSERDITITRIYDDSKDIPEEIKGNQYVLTKKDVIQQFISYAVGCMFGRYSLDEEGLVYAGGEFDSSRYETYSVVEDNIIPITSDVYLEDDLVNRFIEFVETVYGKETLEENLNFIAEALGQKKNETARDTIYSYFLKDFFKDHAKMYSVTGSGRRPIYWKFTSGRENAFNCFIYMHRYDKTTISRIRTEYLHDVQQRLETRKIDLDQILNSDASTTELNKARKEMKTVEKQLAELVTYDEKLRHMADQQIEIDLDDGFNVNYPKFKGLVEKV